MWRSSPDGNTPPPSILRLVQSGNNPRSVGEEEGEEESDDVEVMWPWGRGTTPHGLMRHLGGVDEG
ncbi:hypothetical protein Hanom_Chr10g00945151 [Helianthus anomalus]